MYPYSAGGPCKWRKSHPVQIQLALGENHYLREVTAAFGFADLGPFIADLILDLAFFETDDGTDDGTVGGRLGLRQEHFGEQGALRFVFYGVHGVARAPGG